MLLISGGRLPDEKSISKPFSKVVQVTYTFLPDNDISLNVLEFSQGVLLTLTIF